MRIGLVSPYDLGAHGGVQDQVVRLAGWLREAGHDTIVVGPGTDGPDGAILLGPTRGFTANRANTPIRLDPTVGRRMRETLAPLDVIHVHEPLMPAVSPAALRVRGPVKVATFHADPPAWVRRLYRHGRSGVRYAVRHASVVTAVSPVAASAIEGVVPYRIVPNGIETGDYRTGPKVPGRVVFLGRDDERKGLGVLLEAWPAVTAAHPDATLHVLGSTRDTRVEGVRFLGSVEDDVKGRELASAAIFCAPNLGGESFGIVLAEAMASAAAIVASSLAAFEFVAGDTAILVPPGDATGLADAISALLADPPSASALGAAAAARVRRFSGDTVAAGYLAAYRDALALR